MEKISWDEYFMSLAKISAKRSSDPNTKVGAALVNDRKRIIGLGYNGMPHGDDSFPWGRDGEPKDTKYPYVVHAEINAILNSIVKTDGAILYTSLFPCSNCAKICAQAGIKEVVYEEDKYDGTDDNLIAKKILKKLGIKTRKVDVVKINVE